MSDYLENEWQDLVAKVMPENAPEVQVREMKRFFYMGAIAAVALTTGAASKLSEDEGVVFMRMLRREMREFVQKIKRGEA